MQRNYFYNSIFRSQKSNFTVAKSINSFPKLEKAAGNTNNIKYKFFTCFWFNEAIIIDTCVHVYIIITEEQLSLQDIWQGICILLGWDEHYPKIKTEKVFHILESLGYTRKKPPGARCHNNLYWFPEFLFCHTKQLKISLGSVSSLKMIFKKIFFVFSNICFKYYYFKKTVR